MKTSKNMGAIPDHLGIRGIAWIPVDSCADIIIEIIHAPKSLRLDSNSTSAPVFNLVNPTRVTSQTLSPAIQSHFGNGFQIIPFAEC